MSNTATTDQDIESYTRELTIARLANYFQQTYGVTPPLRDLMAAARDESLGR